MNKEDWKDLLPIIDAFSDGEHIQFNCGDGWVDLGEYSLFDPRNKYRIKPDPRVFEILLQNGVVLGASRCGNDKVERIKAIEILE